MATTGPGVQTVLAAQAGDPRALDSLLAGYLPLIYNIVGRALSGHADVDDVVQETMLRVVRNLGDLRDPAAFRSWLVAVAIRQMRDHYRARQAAPAADLSDEVADPEADFVELTILRLSLSSQREETAQATRWLEPGDRELLALWWLEAAGELDRAEIAAALGVPPSHAAVRIARMKDQLTTARVVVRALRAQPRCAGLAAAAQDWDGVPGPLWRKRLARHVRDCPRCGQHATGLIPAERLLAGLALVPPPAVAAIRLIAPARAALRPAVPSPHPRHAAFGSKLAGSVGGKVLAVSVAAGCAVAGVAAVAHRQHGRLPAAAPAAAATRDVPPAPVTEALAAPPARPARTPARRAPAPPGNAKKGVAAWAFPGAAPALARSGASWYYTWSAAPPGITSPRGVRFVPMIRAAANVTPATLGQVRQEGRYLLGFNEPDMSAQANMSPAQALSLWPQLMATGMRLGSPAVADGAATPGGWLDQFMTGAAARGYRVNFITLHWYGADFATGAAVSQLRGYLQAVYARYHKPIWLTEFALASYGGTPEFPAAPQQAAFLAAAASMLQRLPYVQRYAWFGLQATASDGSMGLFAAGAVPTTTGRAFEAVDAAH